MPVVHFADPLPQQQQQETFTTEILSTVAVARYLANSGLVCGVGAKTIAQNSVASFIFLDLDVASAANPQDIARLVAPEPTRLAPHQCHHVGRPCTSYQTPATLHHLHHFDERLQAAKLWFNTGV